MNVLGNPILRIALGAVASVYLAPKIVNRFVRVELNPIDAKINDAAEIGITAGVTTLTFVILGMIAGKSTAAAAVPA